MIEKMDFQVHNKNENLHEILDEASKEEKLCELAEDIFQKTNEIGIGKSAVVFKDPDIEGLCFKVIHTESELICDVHEESDFLNEVVDLHPGVKVPRPVLSLIASVSKKIEDKIKKEKKSVLAMEEIEGFTLAELVEGKGELPEDFSVDNFMEPLREFFKRMHEKQIFHRDFHFGNIMIEAKTGTPAVIDFGLSAKTYLTDEDPYKTEANAKGQVFVFKDDLLQLDLIEKELKDYLTQR